MNETLKLSGLGMQRTNIELERQRHLANWLMNSRPHMPGGPAAATTTSAAAATTPAASATKGATTTTTTTTNPGSTVGGAGAGTVGGNGVATAAAAGAPSNSVAAAAAAACNGKLSAKSGSVCGGGVVGMVDKARASSERERERGERESAMGNCLLNDVAFAFIL